MDKKQQESKLKLWKLKLQQLEETQLPQALKRIGEAAPVGDWHENAEFEDAETQVSLIQAKIGEIKKIIKNLEKGDRL